MKYKGKLWTILPSAILCLTTGGWAQEKEKNTETRVENIDEIVKILNKYSDQLEKNADPSVEREFISQLVKVLEKKEGEASTVAETVLLRKAFVIGDNGELHAVEVEGEGISRKEVQGIPSSEAGVDLLELPFELIREDGTLVPLGKGKELQSAKALKLPWFIGLKVLPAQIEKVAQDKGLVIQTVSKGSPAESAGLKVGDIVVKVEELSALSVGNLHTLIQEKGHKGEELKIRFLREGEEQIVELTPLPRKSVVKVPTHQGERAPLMRYSEYLRMMQNSGDEKEIRKRFIELESQIKESNKKLEASIKEIEMLTRQLEKLTKELHAQKDVK